MADEKKATAKEPEFEVQINPNLFPVPHMVIWDGRVFRGGEKVKASDYERIQKEALDAFGSKQLLVKA